MDDRRVTQFVPRGAPARRDDRVGDHEQLQREVLDEIRSLRRLFDEFAGSYLNARFPYGKGNDRWSRK